MTLWILLKKHPTIQQCQVIGRITSLDKMPALKSLQIFWALLFGYWNDPEGARNRYLNWHGGTDPYDGNPRARDTPWTRLLPPNIERLRMREDMSDHWATHTTSPTLLDLVRNSWKLESRLLHS